MTASRLANHAILSPVVDGNLALFLQGVVRDRNSMAGPTRARAAHTRSAHTLMRHMFHSVATLVTIKRGLL